MSWWCISLAASSLTVMSLYPDRIPQLRELAQTYGVPALAACVLDLPGFVHCSGSVSEGKHHFGIGGLQQHTWEVVTIALGNRWCCEKDVHPMDAFLAVLFHDVGKVWDYQLVDPAADMGQAMSQPRWIATPHKRLINHMNRSALYWAECATRHNYDPKRTDDVLHAILAHHAEHGSSVMPKTKLAWLVHLSDQMSAWMDQCDRRDPGIRS